MTSFSRRDLLRSGLALSASTLAAGSVGRAHALLAAYPGAASAEAQSAVAPREHLLFDFDWKFFQGHASDPLRDLGFGIGQGDFAKSGELWFSTAKLDAAEWRARGSIGTQARRRRLRQARRTHPGKRRGRIGR